MNAGPAARRSAYRGSGHPRRSGRPSALLLLFLATASVLARVFDVALVLRRALRGPWRAEVAEGSMEPALLPGDWLLLDPTCRRWPRPGSIVVVREPVTGVLAIKRVAARGGGRGVRGARGAGGARGGGGARGRGVQSPRGAASASVTRALPAAPLGTRQQLSAREGWVLGDSPDGSIDSRSYGPLDADDLVARAWFRYGPPGRTGRLR